MRKQLNILFLTICMLFMLAGCGSSKELQTQAESPTSEVAETVETVIEEEPAAEGYEKLGGMWIVGGVYWQSGGVYHRDKLIDVHDNEALEDLYDSVILSFNRDGSFMYANGWIYGGEYIKSATNDNAYILTSTSKLVFKDGELVEEEYSGTTKHLITFIGENTFEFTEYDPITGKARANDYPLVFVKNDNSSSYIDANKIAIERKDGDSNASNSNTTNSSANESLSSYEGLLNAYTRKMEDAVPGLVSEYKSAASGISDIERLAEICNDKVGDLAEICNEGVGKMADLMYSRGDSYDTYEKWAGKLMDNYTDIAMEIQDAYIESAIY